MKIDRPGGPKAPDETPPVAETGRPDQPKKVDFAQTLSGPEGADGATAADLEGVDELVGKLRSGEMGVEAVLDKLVEDAVAGAPLGPEGKDSLRQILRAALESDPTLRRLVREIEQG